MIELAADPEKYSRKLKFGPHVSNTIRNYKKNPSSIAAGKRPKFMMVDFSQNIPILTNIPLFSNVVSIVSKDKLFLSTILLVLKET